MSVDPEVLQMMQDRPGSEVWLTLVGAGKQITYDDLALRVGLEPLGHRWVEVDAARARRFLTAILTKDLAYGSELMPETRATWLAEEFLGAAGAYGATFATNSADMPHEYPFVWTPATGHTFDAGIAVVGTTGSRLYWVADED